jgi:hypothetical protein
VRALLLYCLLCIAALLATVPATQAQSFGEKNSNFFYHDRSGRVSSAHVIHRYWKAVAHAPARVDPRIDPRLRRAATIAQERANARSKARCWHYVKEALVASGIIKSYPKTAYAADAGDELMRDYGFQKLSVHDPYSAPVGAVLVYGDHGRGHVELRTNDGFVSDYHSKNACYYRLRAVYGKFGS